jgi:RHS repeat-associated protein
MYSPCCGQNYKFEGKERDSESNLDNFGARYYSSRMGRWLSADWSAIPEPVPYANPTNPQTLNLYAMVSDNPETFADLDGHDPIMQVAAPAPPAGPGSNMLTNDYDAALQALLASLPPLPVPQQATTPSQNPTDAQAQQQQIKEYVTDEAKAYGVPANIAIATVQRESSFNPNAMHRNKNGTTDYGLMGLNSTNLKPGVKLTGANGKAFAVNGSRARTDWKYNVVVGMSILKGSYTFASGHAPNDVAAATYARYNAGGAWGLYTKPGTQVYQNVQAFMKIYNALGGGP